MLYAVLCYNDEQEVCSWSKEQDDAVMARLLAVQERLAAEGRLGPVARLHGTGRARTLDKRQEPFTITDGPYAETKEQILGFFLIECADDEDAMSVATELGVANPGGAYEVRPVSFFTAGTVVNSA